MKKVFLTFAVVAAVALVSCNNKAKEEAEAAPVDSVEALVVEEETVTIDSVAPAADSAATTATADTTAAK